MGGGAQPTLDARRRRLGAALTHGYSATPLARKLGIGEGCSYAVVADPGHVDELLSPLPPGARRVDRPAEADVVVCFVTARAELEERLGELAGAIHPDRLLWIAWPKRASKVPTDMTEDAVRDVALPLGLVDTKVAAIDGTWSGLRLVWRRERR
ncbi:hypothetical protein [Gaiella sp.]|uniref:hypothetical protein n=1 Tax=Gaiella sp. TaxID=2663207 RepID=UPI002B9A78BE|nr:hypothetical protein [Gaiella sp.]HWO81377.1 hypothetical protein [Gaiella sp.]